MEGGRGRLWATSVMSLLLSGWCSPGTSHGMALACFVWVGGVTTVELSPQDSLRPSFSCFLHPSNRLGERENRVRADGPRLRHLTAHFSAPPRLRPHFIGTYPTILCIGSCQPFLPAWGVLVSSVINLISPAGRSNSVAKRTDLFSH